LRLGWARHQLDAGRKVWPSPEILTWDGWIADQWRRAVLRGAAPTQQLLSPSQEDALWEQVLDELAAEGPSLAAHAGGLIRAAARATQSLLELSRSAMSEEEQLLARALAEVQRRCMARGLFAPRLATPAMLQFLRDIEPPAIAGEPRLSALQEALHQQHWRDTRLLLQDSTAPAAHPQLRSFASLEAELAACARWCLDRLHADGGARLLVISACGEPSLAIQGELLWRQLSGGADDSGGSRPRMLAVEGGAPLHHLGLIGDALLALEFLDTAVDTERLYALLRSPYFDFGSQQDLWGLQGCFERWGLARWSGQSLREALGSVAERQPAAVRLLAWLETLRATAMPGAKRATTQWALTFSEALAAAGFSLRPGLDSSEQQRFERWTALLDEFAALDAVLAPLSAAAAVDRLRRLAAESRHQVASGDAAITLSSALADPVVGYDGIWVLGLTESRWPAPPRPDAYVALREQRSQHWVEASVTERRAQAQWALARWRQRTADLVLSYAEREGDLHHRPTALPGVPAAGWIPSEAPPPPPARGLAAAASDQQFPVLPAAALEQPLQGGEKRLSVQQACPFRAQAQWRLKARAPDPLSDGLTAALRGTLLHLLLQGLWGELRDQASLLSLTPAAEQDLFDRHWRAVVEGNAIDSARWWAPALRERERRRTFDIMAEVLRLERARPPFAVQSRELKLQWPPEGARLNLRIDRVDHARDGSAILIDYKSGAAGRMKLHEDELQPLQLALYVAALAARGERVSAAMLFSLKPGDEGFAGVASMAAADGLKQVEDLRERAVLWQQQLLQLIADHVAGDGTLAREHDACRHCHLPALCRRAAVEDIEDADE
jgi:ATP-dependent helicase/nuclease subunit B